MIEIVVDGRCRLTTYWSVIGDFVIYYV